MHRFVSDYVTMYSRKNASINFFPTTDFLSTGDVDSARMTVELLSRSQYALVAGAYQTANVATSPDTAVPFGDMGSASPYTSTVGLNVPAAFVPLTDDIEDKLLVRFGLIIINSQGTDLELALAAGWVDVKGC
jgi:hypothetical protein